MLEALLLILILVGLLANTMRKPKNYPPGPIAMPVIGHYLIMDADDPQKTFDLFHARFGEIVGMIFPKFKVILLNGYDACKEAFANEDCQGRPDVCLSRDRYDGENYGLIHIDGDRWKVQRRFTLHSIRNLGFGRKDHETVMLIEAESLVLELLAMNGKPFNFTELLAMSAINITWAVLGSKRFPFSSPVLKELAHDNKKITQGLKIFGSVAVGFPFLRYLFPESTGYTSVTTGCNGVLKFIKAAIEEHAKTRIPDNARDFIDIYLQELETAEGKDPSFSEKQLQGICLDFIGASADTVTSVVSFAILFMCLDQQLQDRIYREIREHVGEDRIPTIEDKPKLVYTEATLMEILRFRTPVPIVPHRVTKNTNLRGYQVPENSILFINQKSILMEQSYWKDPENFRPERFISEDGKFIKDERVIAFGKGKRMCMGEALSKMSTFILFAALVQRFSFSFPSNMPVPDSQGVPGFTLMPPAYMVTATPRTRILI